MAADQLGDIAKQHPEDILSLLSRVYPFLLVKKWETRVTAARAVGAIVSNAELWNPNDDDSDNREPNVKAEEGITTPINMEQAGLTNPRIKREEEEPSAKIKIEDELKFKLEKMKEEGEMDLLNDDRPVYSLSQWHLGELFKSGKVLLSSGINDFSESASGNDAEELVPKKPKTEQFSGDVEFRGTTACNPPSTQKKSARMLAMAKRKQKMKAKSVATRSVDITESAVSRKVLNMQKNSEGIGSSQTSEPTILHNPKIEITEQTDKNKLMIESAAVPILEKHEKVAGLVWQFQGIYELLLGDLMNESWEVRHGAALGLRELIKKHAFSIDRIKGASKTENDMRNKRALESLATMLLTIFALDRFGDFVYDTVVAPVRESASQTLAALLLHLDDDTALQVFVKLEQLITQDPLITGLPNKIWEATHGGLLGIRYFVGVKPDFLISRNLMNRVVDMVLYGLNQPDDDVQSVAASILTPITDKFVKSESSKVNAVLQTIWMSLTHLDDDLSSSVGSVMDLFAGLCQYPEVLDILRERAVLEPSKWSLDSLVPKLYPFLRHPISLVRKATLNLFNAFLSIKYNSSGSWLNEKVFRLIFQCILLEQNPEISKLTYDVYKSLLFRCKSECNEKPLDHLFMNQLQPMLYLLNTPIGERGKSYSMDTQFILKPSQNYQLNLGKKRAVSEVVPSESGIPQAKAAEHVNIDAPMIAGDVTLLGAEVIINARLLGAKALGLTIALFQTPTLKSFFSDVLVRCFSLPYATPRMLAAVVLRSFCSAWKEQHTDTPEVPGFVRDIFGPIMSEQLCAAGSDASFKELIPSLKALRTQCQTLLATFVDVGMLPAYKLPAIPTTVQGERDVATEVFTIQVAEQIYQGYYEKLFKSLGDSYKVLAKKPLEDARYRVKLAISAASEARDNRVSAVMSNYAAALLLFSGLPQKLNPTIRALMDSIKSEKIENIQQMSGDSIIELTSELIKCGKPNVANKIIKNLCGFLCVDTSEVPDYSANAAFKDNILTLIKESNFLVNKDDTEVKKVTSMAKIKRKGALYTLGKLLTNFGDQCFSEIPQLKKSLFDSLEGIDDPSTLDTVDTKVGQSIVDSLGILRAVYPYIDPKLQEEEVYPRFPRILNFLVCRQSVFRYSAARTFADMSRTSPVHVMPYIIRNILPLMSSAGSSTDRLGSTELVYHLSISMGTEILPYVIFLIVPLLGRMSDPNEGIRSLATSTFASIIKLVPLEEGIADPEGMPEDLMSGREKERDFMQQMMDPSKAKPFTLPISIKATLRKYQQDGINWLAFLNKYNLHGILCDDMGLGKTLQAICIIASDQYLRKEDYAKTGFVKTRPLPSLIICPPSLTGHWENEFEQFAPFLSTIVYAGGPSTRQGLRDKLGAVDIVITSYDVARNDISYISKHDYNYCVLDEGHIIKNSQSKLAKAVKQISSNHRLILTGTPIQNNVVELWSLFDFLMPGFLGTEKMFQERFAKPIAASRNSKTSSKDQEAGALALEALHKQVLPFMLRRLKEDVLSDLPPKIIQDYYCELSDLQKQLYEDFARKQKNVVAKDIENTAELDSKQHIFQALQYMRKLCNHPALVLSPNHPQLRQVEQYLKETHTNLHDIVNAPKLESLRTLLLECGIGEATSEKRSDNAFPTQNVISQHRALIFCQLKDMLDMIETDLFKKYMPSVTYMRLDGSVDPRDRQKVVKKFNEDPSIDCLLLTTKVGGLGLNLTGADTVIFVEHDWNPMNDLQAMDRAHRLGQKKVVNVYRIITKGTLEEKIMGLQKFKMNVASTVVNQQNSGLMSMDTHQLLDLFNADAVPSHEEEERKPEDTDGLAAMDIVNETGLSGRAKEALGELKELWDPSQYEEEYNLDNFIKTLR